MIHIVVISQRSLQKYIYGGFLSRPSLNSPQIPTSIRRCIGTKEGRQELIILVLVDKWRNNGSPVHWDIKAECPVERTRKDWVSMRLYPVSWGRK
jgi:hypothetical protein